MHRRACAALLLGLGALVGSGGVAAQPSGGAPALVAPTEAAQFDFLVGQWELEVTPKISGLAAMVHGTPKLLGSWKAWHAFDGFGIDDELRIADASGNPVSLSRALRVYDGKTRQWQIGTLDVYRARFSSASATWQAGEMRSNGSGTSPDGRPVLTRSRFHDIGPDRFRLQQDRSLDNGASWEEGTLQIVARRVAAKAPR